MSWKITALIFGLLSPLAIIPHVSPRVTAKAERSSATKRTVIGASTIFDGKGHVLRNTRIVVEDSKIVAIDPKAAPVDYDLRLLCRGRVVDPGVAARLDTRLRQVLNLLLARLCGHRYGEHGLLA